MNEHGKAESRNDYGLGPLLREHNFPPDLQIKSLYVAQIGHLVFSPEEYLPIDQSSPQPITDWKNSEHHDTDHDAESIASEFFSALRSCPNIFDLNQEEVPPVTITDAVFERYSLRFEKSVHFTFKVPARRKQFKFIADPTEQFSVCLFGSNHVAFSEIERLAARTYIGQEFREQIRSMLSEAGGTFRLGQIGPSPLHPYFYLINVSNGSFATPTVVGYERNVFLLVDLSAMGETPAALFEELLSQVSDLVDHFYRQAKQRSGLANYSLEIDNRLSNLMDDGLELHSKSIFNTPITKIGQLRKQLLMILKLQVEFEQLLTAHGRDAQFVSRLIEEDLILGNVSDYFNKDRDEENYSHGPSFNRALEFFEKSLAASDVGIRTIAAAIVGGAIGMFATLLLR